MTFVLVCVKILHKINCFIFLHVNYVRVCVRNYRRTAPALFPSL
jgi:hypothetical protein